jgi:hypothetical protein
VIYADNFEFSRKSMQPIVGEIMQTSEKNSETYHKGV